MPEINDSYKIAFIYSTNLDEEVIQRYDSGSVLPINDLSIDELIIRINNDLRTFYNLSDQFIEAINQNDISPDDFRYYSRFNFELDLIQENVEDILQEALAHDQYGFIVIDGLSIEKFESAEYRDVLTVFRNALNFKTSYLICPNEPTENCDSCKNHKCQGIMHYANKYSNLIKENLKFYLPNSVSNHNLIFQNGFFLTIVLNTSKKVLENKL